MNSAPIDPAPRRPDPTRTPARRRPGRPAPLALVTALAAALFCGLASHARAQPATAPAGPAPAAPAQPAPVPQDVLATGPTGGGGDVFWVARVSLNPDTQAAETRFFARRKDAAMFQVGRSAFPRRAVSVASQQDQLVAVFEGGTWATVSPEGSFASGPGVPAEDARLVAVAAGDAGTLYFVAKIPGGTARVRPPPTPPATTTASIAGPAAAFAAAVGGAPAPATASAAAAKPPEALALLSYGRDGWRAVAEIPTEVAGVPDPVSIAVHDHAVLLLSRRVPGTARLWRLAAGGTWSPVASADVPPTARLAALVAGAPKVSAWVSPGAATDRDHLLTFDLSPAPTTKPATSPTTSPATRPGRVTDSPLAGSEGPPPQNRTVAYAWERYRAARLAGDTVTEQAYDRDTLAAAGDPSSAAFPPSTEGVFQVVRIVVVATAMVVTLLLVLRRRDRERDDKPIDPDSLPLAPVGLRLLAGMIDGSPIVAALLVQATTASSPGGGASPTATALQYLHILGFALFLAHVLVTELLFGRSVGKMLCGLTVTTLDGKRPSAGQVLARNLLRVIDFGLQMFPLLLVPFHPLRQRAGDLAAGTIVVMTDPPEEAEDEV